MQNNSSYNLFDDSLFKKSDSVVLSGRRFYLNKSKYKYVIVGLACDNNYKPCIKISGSKGGEIIFDESEWNHFLSYQGIITNYLYSNDKIDMIDDGRLSLEFIQLPYAKIVKVTKDNSNICLTYESICTLWNILPLITYRINILKNQQFDNYFKILHRSLQNGDGDGDIVINALNLIQPQENTNSENVSTVMELIYMFPEIFKSEFK